MLAVLHASGKDITGIEVRRDVPIYPNEAAIDDEFEGKILLFGRDIDIMVDNNGQEEWHEQKSWQGRNGQLLFKIKPWKWGSGKRTEFTASEESVEKLQGSNSHKQFVLDHIAKELFAFERDTGESREEIQVANFIWEFHKFKKKFKMQRLSKTHQKLISYKV